MEHRLITGGEIYLPFARSRIKALRATGLAYADQSFEIDGCSIKVRIEPGHEYITLSGGYEYRVLPTSAEHLIGNSHAKPEALASVSGSRVQLQPHAPRIEGAQDWVSYDGLDKNGAARYGSHLLTWNGGNYGRYNPSYAPAEGAPAENFIWVDGKKVDIGRVPMGAGMVRKKLPDGSTKIVILFAERISMTRMSIRHFSMSDVVAGAAESVLAGEFDAPQADESAESVFLQQVFFCGRGEVFATLVSTTVTPSNAEAVRFFQVSGAVVTSDSGEVTVSWTSTPLEHSLNLGGAMPSNGQPPVTTRHIEYIGVDVKVTGEITPIKHQVVSTFHGKEGSFRVHRTPYNAHEIGSHWEQVVSLSCGTDLMYEATSISGHLVSNSTGSTTNDWSSGDFRQTLTGAYTIASMPETFRGVITHDLDARFGTHVYTRSEVFGPSSSYSVSIVVTDAPIIRTSSDPIFGPYTPPHVNNFIGVRAPSGQVVEKPYQVNVTDGSEIKFRAYPMPGTPKLNPFSIVQNSSWVTSVCLLNRRMASRRNGSFLASTAPFTRRKFESDTVPPQVLQADRTLTVVARGGAAPSATAVKPKSAGLPESDTEVALFGVYPIYK